MSRSFRTLLVLVLAVGLLLGLGSFSKTEAVKILGDVDNPFNETGEFLLSGCGGDCTYYAAYEYYGNQTVIAGQNLTNPNVTIPDVIIKFVTGKNYSNGENVSVRLTNGKFVSPGSQPLTGGLPPVTQYCLYDGTTVVAVLNGAHTYPTNQLFFYFNQPVNADTKLTLSLCTALGTYRTYSRWIQIDPDLNTSCTKGADVKIEWFAADGDCCEAKLIEIKTMASKSATLNFTAELDTEKDFKKFVGNNDILNACCSGEGAACPINQCPSGTSCLKSTSPTQTPSCPEVWVLGDKTHLANNSIIKLSFNIQSANDEPGIQKISYKPNYPYDPEYTCTKIDNKNWNCTFNCVKCPNCPSGEFLRVYLDGTNVNNPTVWNISNVSIENVCQISPAIKDICCSVKAGEAGVWYGGLEVLVPFVRHDPANGFYTTIKLINRYKTPVKVYAAPFASESGQMILPTKEIGEIPASGDRTLTITGFNLASYFGNAFLNGAPLKIHVRVPGANSYVGKDPYVEGIVVSDSIKGTRTIPLKFKSNQHGAYVE